MWQTPKNGQAFMLFLVFQSTHEKHRRWFYALAFWKETTPSGVLSMVKNRGSLEINGYLADGWNPQIEIRCLGISHCHHYFYMRVLQLLLILPPFMSRKPSNIR